MLRIAAKVFGEHGYDHASMNKIASACGISKPMLYAYFGSKEGLYREIIANAGVFVVKEMARLAEEREPQRRLEKAADILISFVEHYRDSWQMVFSTAREQPSIQVYRKHVLTATIMTLAQFRPGTMPKQDAQALVEPYAYVLLGSAEAAAEWWVAAPDVPRERLRELSQEVIGELIADVRSLLSAAQLATPGGVQAETADSSA